MCRFSQWFGWSQCSGRAWRGWGRKIGPSSKERQSVLERIIQSSTKASTEASSQNGTLVLVDSWVFWVCVRDSEITDGIILSVYHVWFFSSCWKGSWLMVLYRMNSSDSFCLCMEGTRKPAVAVRMNVVLPRAGRGCPAVHLDKPEACSLRVIYSQSWGT